MWRRASASVRAPSPSMSKEQRRSCGSRRHRSSASWMSRPTTNSPPRICIARRSASRTTGSPARRARAPNQPPGLPRSAAGSSTRRPVSISAQVEALTNREPDRPACAAQSPPARRSAINWSAVSSSGTRSSDSARHISAMPSGLDSPNSCRKASSVERSASRARAPATIRRACCSAAARCAGVRVSVKRCMTCDSSSMGCRPSQRPEKSASMFSRPRRVESGIVTRLRYLWPRRP